LARSRCKDLLGVADHGVLATVHRGRGVDAVPVCFVLDDERVAVPIDRVKPKSSPVLQRQRNLDHDARAVLLVEQWDPIDWSRLWWVRASLTRMAPAEGERDRLASLLALKYRQYQGQPFVDLTVFDVTGLSGWSGGAEGPGGT
jgi:Pyridoxamine 5'-phosphate oxidase